MTVYLIIGAYLLLMLLSGLVGYRKSNQTPEDYFMANRGIGTVIMFFTFIATNFSAFFFLGFAGEGYKTGYSYYAMMAFGTAFAALSFYWIGYRVWKMGKKHLYITPAEMIGDQTGNNALKLVFLFVMVFFTLPYMAIQPIGAGIILETLTGGDIPYFLGSVILTAFIVVYVFLGGMRTVALTDLIQGVLMFVLMFSAVSLVADALGGFNTANQKVFAIKPELFSRHGGGDYFSPQKWFSLMILWLLCVPMFPQMFMRFYISKDLKAFKTSTILYALVPCVLFICPVMIGVWGHLSFPGLEGKAADNILPMMLDLHAPKWLAALIMTGALAAFMSTLDSQLLAISTMLTRDLYVSFIDRQASLNRQVITGRALVIIAAVIALLIAFQPPATIFNIAKHAFTGFAVLFPITFAVLYNIKVSPYVLIAAIAAGELMLGGIVTGFIPASYYLGFDAVVPTVGIAALITALGAIYQKYSPHFA